MYVKDFMCLTGSIYWAWALIIMYVVHNIVSPGSKGRGGADDSGNPRYILGFPDKTFNMFVGCKN
jgi:hypothetical protein